MLIALMDMRALTASELAAVAGVTPQTASGHLSRMLEGGLLRVEAQGRHRYYRLRSAEVAGVIENIMQVSALDTPPAKVIRTGPADQALRRARTCYDHIAGQLGVAVMDALMERGAIVTSDGVATVTDAGAALLASLGIRLARSADFSRVHGSRRLSRVCLDWSERRYHLAGAVGAALCSRALEEDWVRRIENSRALLVTPKGRHIFADMLGVSLV